MKKISLLLSLLFIVSASFGQRIADKWSFDKRNITFQLMEADNDKVQKAENNIQRGVTIWSEDWGGGIDNGSSITTLNGDWAKDGPDGAIWRWNTQATNGCWSGGTGIPAVTTAANGFMQFDADSANCQDPDTNPPTFTQIEWIGSIVSPAIDLSATDGVVLLEWEHEYRWCCTESNFSVAMSTDGGLTWGEERQVITGVANTAVAETYAISFCGANSTMTHFRWSWNAPSHYYWAIDDITLSIPTENDIAVTDASYSTWDSETAVDYIDLEYSILPEQQQRPIDFKVTVENRGSTQQTGVQLNVAITNSVGTEELSSAPMTLDPCTTMDIVIEDFSPDWVLGEHIVSMEVVQDQTDVDPSDQLAEEVFWFENDIMARDGRNAGASYTNTGTLGHTLGAAYGMNNDATIYAIGVAMSSESDDDSEWTVELWGDGASDFEFLVGGDDDLTFTGAMGNGGNGGEFMTYIMLEEPYDVEAGLDYYAHFKAYGGDDNEAFVRTSGTAPDQTCFVYIEEDLTWYFTNAIPMVRPAFAEEVSIAEATISDRVKLGQNVPNPVHDITTIAYELISPEYVKFEILDLTGKVVMEMDEGLRTAGLHRIELNNDNLNAGIYYYSIIIDNDRLTKKMVITK